MGVEKKPLTNSEYKQVLNAANYAGPGPECTYLQDQERDHHR